MYLRHRRALLFATRSARGPATRRLGRGTWGAVERVKKRALHTPNGRAKTLCGGGGGGGGCSNSELPQAGFPESGEVSQIMARYTHRIRESRKKTLEKRKQHDDTRARCMQALDGGSLFKTGNSDFRQEFRIWPQRPKRACGLTIITTSVCGSHISGESLSWCVSRDSS